MAQTKQDGRKLAGLVLLGSVIAVASCSVDTSNLVFDDDLVNGGKTSGGSSSDGADGAAGETGSGGGNGSGGSSSGGCSASELRCDGRQVQICAAGDWIDVGGECPFACVDGACTGVCKPGNTQCVSDTVVQTCGDNGEWGAASVCEFACVGGGCGGECEPGASRCGGENGLRPQTCNHQGVWVDARESDCAEACEDGSCTSCEEGETQCISSTHVQACDPPNWGATTPCPFACVGTSCGGSCVPGSRICASSHQYRACGVNGELGAPVSCGNQACVGDGECVGECRPGTGRCSGSTIQECSADGTWKAAQSCRTPQTCLMLEGKPFCGECIPGSQRCNGWIVEECTQDAVWKESEDCDKNSLLCYEGQCREQRTLEKICAQQGSVVRGCFQGGKSRFFCEGGKLQGETCPRLTSCSGNSGICSLL